MANYHETDDRSYLAQNVDELRRGLVLIRSGLRDIDLLRQTLEFVPPEDDAFSDRYKEIKASHRASDELLLQEIAASLGIVATGSVEAITQKIDDLRQIERVEEAFPRQPG